MPLANHTCLLCHANADRQFVKSPIVYGGQPEQQFWQCAVCDAIYLYPATTDKDDMRFYETEFDKWMAKRSGDDTWTQPDIQFSKMQKRELPLRMPWLEKMASSGERVLEIGSSSGFTLAVLKERGCDCVGLEVSPEYAAYARQLGLPTYMNWQELELAGYSNFDLVLHYYVLEHVNDPLSFLRQSWRYVAPGGRMMFEVPNGNDPLSALYHIPAFEDFYWWRAHHWYFTPKSLAHLLDQLGRPYEIHPGQRYDLSNHLHWMLTGQPGGMGKYSHIFSRETEQSYAEDLKRNWLCDYIVAVIR